MKLEPRLTKDHRGMRGRDHVKLYKLTVVAREDEMQGLYVVSNSREKFSI